MRRIALHATVALITFVVGISVAGAWQSFGRKPAPQSTPPRFKPKPASATDTSDPRVEEIRDLYRQYAAAQTNHDVGFFERVEAESFILTYLYGGTLTRDQAIASMKTWNKHNIYSNKVLDIRFYGDAAIVKGEMTATYPDSRYSHTWQWLDVIKKRGEHWQILSTTQISD